MFKQLEGVKFKHFKGNEYIIICIAKHTEIDDYMVIYQDVSSAKIWARPFKMFFDVVDKPEYKGPRFIKIS